MTGETPWWRVGADVQPGGRRPAPGELAFVQAFVNSHYDLEIEHGQDLLATPAALKQWLLARDLIDARTAVRQSEWERAISLRESLRGLAATGTAPAENLLDGATVAVRFTEDGNPWFAQSPAKTVGGSFGVLLALTARAMIEGQWSRLKVCPGDDCGWAFYDHSRNQTGRWCSMSVCGGRAKARAHYQRSRRPSHHDA